MELKKSKHSDAKPKTLNHAAYRKYGNRKTFLMLNGSNSWMNTSVPRRLRLEFLNNYATIFSHVYNSCDYNLLWSYMNRFRVPETFSTYKLLMGGGSEKESTVLNRLEVAKHMWGRMNETPDSTFTLKQNRIIFDSDDCCLIKFNYSIVGTKQVPFNQILSVAKSNPPTSITINESKSIEEMSELGAEFEELLDSLIDDGMHETANEYSTDNTFTNSLDEFEFSQSSFDDNHNSPTASSDTSSVTTSSQFHAVDNQSDVNRAESALHLTNITESFLNASLLKDQVSQSIFSSNCQKLEMLSLDLRNSVLTPEMLSVAPELMMPMTIEYNGECTLILDRSYKITGAVWTLHPIAMPIPMG